MKKLLFMAVLLLTLGGAGGPLWADPTPIPTATVVLTPWVFVAGDQLQYPQDNKDVNYSADWTGSDDLFFYISIPEDLWQYETTGNHWFHPYLNGCNGCDGGDDVDYSDTKTLTLNVKTGYQPTMNFGYRMFVNYVGGTITAGSYSAQMYIASGASGTPITTPVPFGSPIDIEVVTPTFTDTVTPTITETPVDTATETPVDTATDTPVDTATDTPVDTDTITPTITETETPVDTATDTPVDTDTATPTITETYTITDTFTDTDTFTATPTITPTFTVTRTITPTFTITRTPTNTPTVSYIMKTFGGTGDDEFDVILKTSDNKFVCGGYSKSFNQSNVQDIYLAKVDAKGDCVWAKTYSTNSDMNAIDVIEIPGNKYVAIGYMSACSPAYQCGYMLCVDTNGNSLWSSVTGSPSLNAQLQKQGGLYYNNNIYTVGYGNPTSPTNYNISVSKHSSTGALIKRFQIGDATHQTFGYDLDMDNKHNIVVVGTTDMFSNAQKDLYVIKVDADLNCITSRSIVGANFTAEMYTCFYNSASDTFLLTGFISNDGVVYNPWIVQVDDNLNVLFQYKGNYGGLNYGYWGKTVNNRAYVLGATDFMHAGILNGIFQVFSNDFKQSYFMKTYGGANNDELISFDVGMGKIAMSGYTTSYGAGGKDAWLIIEPQSVVPVPTATPAPFNISSAILAGDTYGALGNTSTAMYYYYQAVSAIAKCYPKAVPTEQVVLYKAGLMLDNRFKALTNYDATMKNINKMQPIPKATAQHNFAIAMKTPQPLINEAPTHFNRALTVTGTAKTGTVVNSINKEKNWIVPVQTFIATH